MRACEHCHADISHKRRDARFCDRNCKMAAWHQANRATSEGKASERERNRSRYRGEAPKRRAGAMAYYYSNQAARIEYAKRWRRDNPERRRAQGDIRAARQVENRDYCPFDFDEWMKLVNRFKGRCAYCDKRPNEPLHRDHVIPLARGGRHAIANILPACADCNRRKSDLLLSEWRRRTTYPRR